MIKRPVPLTLTARRTPSKLTYWRTLLARIAVELRGDGEVISRRTFEAMRKFRVCARMEDGRGHQRQGRLSRGEAAADRGGPNRGGAATPLPGKGVLQAPAGEPVATNICVKPKLRI